jgi:hypothetical protein
VDRRPGHQRRDRAAPVHYHRPVLGSRRAAGPRAQGLTVSVGACRAALAVVIALLVVLAYYPFTWDPPHSVHNQVTRTGSGALRFGTSNKAATLATPGWLPVVRRSGEVQIRLDADPRSARQHAPMMMLGSDFWHVDFAIAQERSDLDVWLRRPGSRVNGAPPFVIPGVIRPGQWISVDVAVRGGRLSISVAGRARLTGRVPAGGLQGWAPGRVALGGDVQDSFPWQGQIRVAEVRTPGYTADYLRPGALSIPASYLLVPGHIEPFPPVNARQWLLALVDLLTFIPAGFLIAWSRRPPIRPVPATLLAAAFAVLLAAGKFLFSARHTSLANVLGQAIGALLGALLAWWLARNRTRRPGSPPLESQIAEVADAPDGGAAVKED